METRISPTLERMFPLLVGLCVASGCAALIYQVIWFQLLSLVLGASSVSLGVLLGTFMGGMCIGSLILWRVVSACHHPLRVFAFIELGIGIFGLLVLAAMPIINSAYAALAGPGASGMAGMILRASVAGACLLPPTILMGATLPAIARWLKTTPSGISRLGFCYGANIFGAVTGSLLAGFYLLRVHDVAVATFAAVALNAAVALSGLVIASKTAHVASTSDKRQLTVLPSSWTIYVSIALSGMTALSAEVIWTRHLSLLLGATVYTFALVLAAFLFGLGLGSTIGSVASRHIPPRLALGICQLLLCVAIAWTAFTLTRSLPYWPLDVTLPATSFVMLQLDFVRVLWAVSPAAILWGASFPLALAAAAAPGQDPGRLLGGLYAANTVGAIIGALGTGFVLVVWLGSQHAQQLLILISACSGLLILVPAALERPRLTKKQIFSAAAIFVAIIALTVGVPPLPGSFVAYGRFMPTRGVGSNVIYMGEGLTASVAVSVQEDGILTYHSAGKAQASTYPQDMRLQRMLGHLTTLVPEDGHSFLVIGLGSGITAGAVSIDPRAERVVIADIEPLTQKIAGEFFREQNFGVTDNPNVEIRIDDGRHYLLTTDETFDGITSDPFDPWVKGAATLYTREFWELVRSRLNPGGVVTVFVQLYESTEEAVKSEVATFFEVFPNGSVFANTVLGSGYDVVLLARADDTLIDVDRIYERLQRPEYGRVAQSLQQVGFRTATDLLGTYSGQASELSSWLEGAALNTDRNLRLQYLAGQGLNLYRAELIFDNMQLTSETDPQDYFTASPPLMDEIERIIRARETRN
jgi:spermidine synthase